MASYLIAVGIFLTFAMAVTGLIAFDRLIQHQHRNYREEWERVGKPWLGALSAPLGAVSVFRAKPPCSKPLRFVPPLTYSWFFRPPEWSRRDKEVKRWLLVYRICFLLFHGVWLIVVSRLFIVIYKRLFV
jgi:hypothetical protein